MLSIEERKTINTLMNKYGAENWILFEDINLNYPTSADLHFLIIVGKYLDLTKYRKLKDKIKNLPRLCDLYMEFNTLDDIKYLVEHGKLNKKILDEILYCTEKNKKHTNHHNVC